MACLICSRGIAVQFCCSKQSHNSAHVKKTLVLDAESRVYSISDLPFSRLYGCEGMFENMQSKAAEIPELPLKEGGRRISAHGRIHHVHLINVYIKGQ